MKKRIGLIGEKLAEKYIRDKGYRILERNYRTRLGELDLIAYRENIIIFIEVKTRTSNSFGTPSQSINRKKQKTIKNLSQQYILGKKLNKGPFVYRFDVIEVFLLGKKYKINHIEAAF